MAGSGVGFLKTDRKQGGLGQHCKLPQRDPGQSPSRQTVSSTVSTHDGVAFLGRRRDVVALVHCLFGGR